MFLKGVDFNYVERKPEIFHAWPEYSEIYRGAVKSLTRPTSQCILFDDENISFDASLVIYINSTTIYISYFFHTKIVPFTGVLISP
jgi:hypothetical protein